MEIKLTNNEEHAKKIFDRLADNKVKYGERYCPCVNPKKYVSEEKQDYICPCKPFRDLEEGMCHCQLFEKTNDKNDTELTYYDQQRMIINQINPIEKITKEGKQSISDFISEYKKLCLMCRELYDFSIISCDNKINSQIIDLIEEMLQNRGILFDYGLNQADGGLSYDFWIKTHQDGEIHLFKLFDGEPLIVE